MQTPPSPIEQYRLIRPRYERLGEKCAQLMREFMQRQGINAEIEHRVKTVESFTEKISRPGKNYPNPLNDLTDLAGLRIILNSLSDVEKVAAIVERELDVDADNSLNKADQLDPDRFGYLSQHYVVRIKPDRAALSDWSDLSGLRFEIQVRTTLQHAWAVIQHVFDYKASIDVPRKLRRRLFRVSALLELADEELDSFSKEVKTTIINYEASLAKGDSNVDIDVDSLKVFIEGSDEVKYWNNYLQSVIKHKVASWGDLSRDVKLAQFVGITKLAQLEAILTNSRGWGEVFLKRYFDRFYRENSVTPDKVFTVVNGTTTMLVIASHPEQFTPEVLARSFGFGTGYILEESRIAKESLQSK